MSELTLAPLSSYDVGGACAAAIAIAAYRTRSLTGGGAAGAFVIGTATYGALGLAGAVVLLAFFVTSVALSRIGKARKTALLVDVGKTGSRDAAQVFANGGVAAACALLAASVDHRYAYAFAGAFAAATADTWGTEIGTLARRTPRSILTLRPVTAGLSGGVTLPGTLAEVAGALTIGLAALTLGGVSARPAIAVAVACAGVLGATADSVLGASLQSLRWCPNCARATEREPHTCGANTAPLRGLGWFGNDATNFCATLVGAAAGYVLVR